MEVDGAVVHRRVGALALDQAEHGAGRRVDHRERVGARRAQRDAGGRVVAARPRRSPPACGGSSGSSAARSSATSPSTSRSRVVERRLEGGRPDVAVEHARVRVVEDRRLDPPPEQRLRLAHEVLVERVLARDEDRQAVAAPPGAAPLLAEARHRAGEAGRDHAVEQPDVDAELERVGRGDSEQLAGGQPLLDLAPLCRRVAGAVRGEPVAVLRAEPVGGEPVDQLRRLPALREAERAQPALDERGHQARRLAERACADAELLVEQLAGSRARSSAPPAARRRRRHGDVDAEQRARELGRGSRSSPRRAGTGARRRRSARSAGAGGGRCRRASRRRRGRRAPRRRRRRRGSRARRPSGRDGEGRRRGACRGWTARGSTTCGSASGARPRCRRRRSPAGRAAPSGRSASGAGPGRAPSSGRGRARAASARGRARRVPAG